MTPFFLIGPDPCVPAKYLWTETRYNYDFDGHLIFGNWPEAATDTKLRGWHFAISELSSRWATCWASRGSGTVAPAAC